MQEQGCKYSAASQSSEWDSNPSRQDIEVTIQVLKAGRILGIHLIDHIIIGDNNYTSLNEYGCFE